MIKLLEIKEDEGEEDEFLGFKHKFPSITPMFSSVSYHIRFTSHKPQRAYLLEISQSYS